MKKTLVASCLDAIRDTSSGERYGSLIRYFIPEFLAAFVLYALVTLIDARMIAHLKSTELYATMSVTNPFIHFMVKIAEGLSVGTMVLCGYYHGRNDQEGVLRAVASSCATTLAIGGVIASFLYYKAAFLYWLLGTPESLIAIGVPFLRMRAIAIGLMFVFFALIGILRGIKRNRSIIYFFGLGSVVFVICDYLFIFGACGCPQLGLCGSAMASVIQYSVMVTSVTLYMMLHTDVRRYLFRGMYRHISWAFTRELWALTLPVMGDKAVLAFTKLILMKHIANMGTIALGSFNIVRDLEMVAFIPAVALAQVVTFLVSNELGARDYEGAKYTVKRALMLAGCMVIFILLTVWFHLNQLVSMFDTCNVLSGLAIQAFPIVSVMVIFDVVQVILAGALRGAAQGRMVLWVRMMSLLCFCLPVMYSTSFIAFQSDFVKFITIYGSFYMGNVLMAIWYIYWFRSGRWQQVGWSEV